MAEGDGYIYDEFKYQLLLATHDMDTDALYVAMFTSSYVPDVATDTLYSGISTYEVSGTGYTAGGEAVTTPSVTKDETNNRALFDADDVTWTSLGALSPQPAYAVLYNSATGSLIAYWEIETLTNGGDYSLQFSSDPAAVLLIS